MKKNKGRGVIVIFIIVGIILFGYLGYRVKNDFFKGSERKKLDSIELYGYTLSKNDTSLTFTSFTIGSSCVLFPSILLSTKLYNVLPIFSLKLSFKSFPKKRCNCLRRPECCPQRNRYKKSGFQSAQCRFYRRRALKNDTAS